MQLQIQDPVWGLGGAAHPGQCFSLLADYPRAWSDVKHLQAEATTPAATPKELYDRILAVQPYTGCGFLRAVRPGEVQVGGGAGVSGSQIPV